MPKKSKLSSVRKVVIDRLLFAPPYLFALFYTVAILEVRERERERDRWVEPM